MSSWTVEEYQKGPFTVKIEPDDRAGNPFKEFDQLGSFYMVHRNYVYGEKNFHDASSFEHALLLEIEPDGFDEEEDNIVEMIGENIGNWEAGKVVILPVWMYDHSGVSFSTSHSYPYNCPWDSGFVGYIFATYDKIEKEYTEINEENIAKITEVLEAEIKTLDMYARGEVYGVVIKRDDADVDCDCWGFYGVDAAKEYAEEVLEPLMNEYHKEEAEIIEVLQEGTVD